MENETTETSTSGCGEGFFILVSRLREYFFSHVYSFDLDSGSLILEMGTLSRLTGDPRYESAALRALRKLWSMRSSLNLLGTTLDVVTGDWIEHSSGIGAGRYFSRLCNKFCTLSTFSFYGFPHTFLPFILVS